MKSLMTLWKQVAMETATWCCTSAAMDIKTTMSRIEHEGISFLTITLPTFGKAFERSLDQGWVDPALFTGFRFRGGLPVFLRGFLDRVFDSASGRLVDDPCIDSIRSVRQLTLMFSKVSLPCSDTRTRRAYQGYIDCEKELREAETSESNKLDFIRISRLLFRDVFSLMDRKIYEGDVIPKHGPGSTADKLSGNGKYRLATWTDRLEDIFPYGEYCLPSWSYNDQLSTVEFLEPGAEVPVKVLSVPKTLKTPRIIAMEPACMQYMQQAIAIPLVEALESDFRVGGLLGFTNQVPNQELARESSSTGELATLDMSEASDRVSNQHVEWMLADHRWLSTAVSATRSTRAEVPGHGIHTLTKFASMGSALCFPMEAMVFLTVIFLGIERELKRPLTLKDIQAFKGSVRVYGDDIIIPVDFVRSVCDALHDFNHVVNIGKSFWTGRFRESCGKEFYCGHDVSIVKVRNLIPSSRRDATGCISLVSLRNQMYFSGYWQTVKWIDRQVRELIHYFPTVLPTSPVLGRHSFLGYYSERTGRFLHNPIVTGYVVSAPLPRNPLDGSGALLKYFLKRGTQPFADRRHLERSGRPHAVSIKLRKWASAV